MKSSPKISLLFLFLFFGLKTNAQQFFALSFVDADTTEYFYTDTIKTQMIMFMSGPGIYQGQLKFGYKSPTGTNQPDTINIPNPTIVIQSGQQLTYEVNIPVKMETFGSGGGHTVIVWPILAPAPPDINVDSAEFNTLILGWMEIENAFTEKPVRIFPVPAQDEIFMESESENMEVSIFNLTGQCVLNMKTSSTHTRIPIDGLSPGIYVMHWRKDKGKMESQRFIVK